MKYLTILLILLGGVTLTAPSASAWEWAPQVPGSVKDGTWRGDPPQNCSNSPKTLCTTFGEHMWFHASKGEYANVCHGGQMAYCKNTESVYEEYGFVGKAPNKCITNEGWNDSICPNAPRWGVIARDKWGDGYSMFRKGYIYLCGRTKF